LACRTATICLLREDNDIIITSSGERVKFTWSGLKKSVAHFENQFMNSVFPATKKIIWDCFVTNDGERANLQSS
jgi:hypothetical protein